MRTVAVIIIGLLIIRMAGSCGGPSTGERQAVPKSVAEGTSAWPDSLAWKAWRDRTMDKVDPSRGRAIYRQHCRSCHRWEEDDVINALRSARNFPEPRARNLYNFIMHEDSLVRSGDLHVMEIRRDHNWEGKDWDHSQLEIAGRDAMDLVLWMLQRTDGLR